LGALAQLAAIDQAALQSGTLAEARAVITGWALPAGPTAGELVRRRRAGRILDRGRAVRRRVPAARTGRHPLMG
jgi:hypothetical protein